MTNPSYPLSPPHPLPYRQPTYKAHQRIFSPPASVAPPQSDAQPTSEVDDGGWGVDADPSAYIARMKRRKARSQGCNSNFGIMHGSSGNWENEENLRVEPHSWPIVEVQAPEEDPVHEAKEEPEIVQAPLTDLPIQASSTPFDHTQDPLAALFEGRPITSVNAETLSRIKAILDASKPTTPPPPPPPPTYLPLSQSPPIPTHPELEPNANAEISTPPKTEVTGNPYPFGRASGPHTYNGNHLGSNHFALPVPNRWGNRTPAAVDSPPHPTVRAGNITPTPTPAPVPYTVEPRQDLLQAAAAAQDASSDGGWTPDSMVREWARDVTTESPLRQSSTPSEPSLIHSTEADGVELDFAGLDVSDAESVDTDLPTPGKRESPSPVMVELLPVVAQLPPPPPPSTHRTDDRRTYDSGYNEYRRQASRLTPARWEKSEVSWKRDPHPAFSNIFVNKRLLIKFPYPIHRGAVKPAMWDHFARWGSVRMTWYHEPIGNDVQQVLIVVDTEESTNSCLADDKRLDCPIQLQPRAEPTLVPISVTRSPKFLTAKYVFVKITGPRHDAPHRSRSASPRRGDRPRTSSPGSKRNITNEDEFDNSTAAHNRPLPPYIMIDSVPKLKWGTDTVEEWARVRETHLDFESIRKRAYAETGREAWNINTIDLGRRVPEKDIIPRLCSYFAEILDAAPAQNGGGWLIAVGNASERGLMDQLAKIPGLLARRARDDDGNLMRAQSDVDGSAQPPTIHVRREFEHQPSDVDQSSALPQLEIKQEEAEIQHAQVPESKSESLPNQRFIPIPPAHHPQPATSITQEHPHHPSSPPDLTATPSTSHSIAPTPPTEMFDPHYPHLRKVLIPTYRGRALREESGEESPRWFDDAAVFVGRLVKEQETEISLFERFSRYGQVCGIEYNPRVAQRTYATARILYASLAAADRALQYEQGAVSFGSMLKIEKRRVLPIDAQMVEKYIDDFGRAYSPSMVSQYSPPQRPVEDELHFVQPPPLNTGPIPFHGGPGVMQWIPFPPPVPHPLQSPTYSNGQAQPAPFAPSPNAFTQQQAPPPSGTPDQSGLIPMMYAMGLSHCPPAGLPAGYTLFPSPSTRSGTLPTPPITPYSTLFPQSLSTQLPPTIGDHGVDATHLHIPPAPIDPIPSPTDIPTEDNSGSSRRRSPLLLNTKMENGVLKAVYDTEDLRRFRREAGIAEPEIEEMEVREIKVEYRPLDIGGSGDAPWRARSEASSGDRGVISPPLPDNSNIRPEQQHRPIQRLVEGAVLASPPTDPRRINAAARPSPSPETYFQHIEYAEIQPSESLRGLGLGRSAEHGDEHRGEARGWTLAGGPSGHGHVHHQGQGQGQSRSQQRQGNERDYEFRGRQGPYIGGQGHSMGNTNGNGYSRGGEGGVGHMYRGRSFDMRGEESGGRNGYSG